MATNQSIKKKRRHHEKLVREHEDAFTRKPKHLAGPVSTRVEEAAPYTRTTSYLGVYPHTMKVGGKMNPRVIENPKNVMRVSSGAYDYEAKKDFVNERFNKNRPKFPGSGAGKVKESGVNPFYEHAPKKEKVKKRKGSGRMGKKRKREVEAPQMHKREY